MSTMNVLIDELEWARCDNCRKRWRGDKLKPMLDIEERLDPVDGTVPAGECPSCGALCYVCDGPRPKGTPRAFTAKEVQKQILAYFRDVAKYRATVNNGDTVEQRCMGVAFDILVFLDGHIGSFPAFDLYPAPHPNDKQHCIDTGRTYYDPKMKVNDVLLHEAFYKGRKHK